MTTLTLLRNGFGERASLRVSLSVFKFGFDESFDCCYPYALHVPPFAKFTTTLTHILPFVF